MPRATGGSGSGRSWTCRSIASPSSTITARPCSPCKSVGVTTTTGPTRSGWKSGTRYSKLLETAERYQIASEGLTTAEKRLKTASVLLQYGQASSRRVLDAQHDRYDARNVATNMLDRVRHRHAGLLSGHRDAPGPAGRDVGGGPRHGPARWGPRPGPVCRWRQSRRPHLSPAARRRRCGIVGLGGHDSWSVHERTVKPAFEAFLEGKGWLWFAEGYWGLSSYACSWAGCCGRRISS